MAIEKVIIQNFKKFKNPFEVKFNENINLLVGDNESGKSTLLNYLKKGSFKVFAIYRVVIGLAIIGLYISRM